MMTDDEIITVVQAHKEGKKIQFRPHGAISWTDCDYTQWSFPSCDYRVAPESRKPREWEVIVGKNGELILDEPRCWHPEQIRVREVLGESSSISLCG